jgi:hypothetical protein
MPLIQDIYYIPGDTLPIDGSVTGVNLTGSTVRFHLRQDEESEIDLLTEVATVTSSTAYTLTLTAEETTGLKGAYFYLVKVTDTLGQVTTVTTGTFTDDVPLISLSYATVDYADAYFDNALFTDPWGSTSAGDKAKALKMATRKIDALPLKGVKANEDQPLEFPRNNEHFIYDNVKQATCEEALAILRGGANAGMRAELQKQGVKSFSLGPLSESYSDASTPTGKLISPTATQLLSRYTGGSWSIV